MDLGYFVRSGWVALYLDSLKYFGVNGYGWSSISAAYSSATPTNAYVLDFYALNVGPSAGPFDRFVGTPVRCLVYYVV